MLKKIVLGLLLVTGLSNAGLIEKKDYKTKDTIFVYKNDTKSKFMVENDTGLIKTGEVVFLDDNGKQAIKLQCTWSTPNPQDLICQYDKTFIQK